MIRRPLRSEISALVLSATALIGIITSEHYTEKAVIPTKNDRPTVGFGSTFREDGTPVQIGDKIDPVRAIKRTSAHIAKDEAGLKRCVTAPLSQTEYDILVDFAYQYGTTATCKSSVVLFANAGKYRASCASYTLYKRSGGYDCSTLVDGKPNKRCWGVWTRNNERQAQCLSAQ